MIHHHRKTTVVCQPKSTPSTKLTPFVFFLCLKINNIFFSLIQQTYIVMNQRITPNIVHFIQIFKFIHCFQSWKITLINKSFTSRTNNVKPIHLQTRNDCCCVPHNTTHRGQRCSAPPAHRAGRAACATVHAPPAQQSTPPASHSWPHSHTLAEMWIFLSFFHQCQSIHLSFLFHCFGKI